MCKSFLGSNCGRGRRKGELMPKQEGVKELSVFGNSE